MPSWPGLVHGRGDIVEVLDELDDHVLVGRVVGGELDREFQHVLAEEGHPRRAVRLLQVAAGGQRRAAVEDADVVEAEEAALEDVLAEAVLAVHPPGEVQQQLVERRLEEIDVRLAAQGLLGAMEEQRRPGMDRRVHVAEVPLVGGHLAAGMQVDAAAASVPSAAWRSRGPRSPAAACGRPGPRPRTRDTPTCRASR